MSFPTGREQVTRYGSRLTNSKANKTPIEKQHFELSTRTWSGRAQWNRSKFVNT